MAPGVESEDVIAFSQPARSHLGQASDCPEVINTNPLAQRILDSNNLVRADTAITGKRPDKNKSELLQHNNREEEYCAISQPEIENAGEGSLHDAIEAVSQRKKKKGGVHQINVLSLTDNELASPAGETPATAD